MGMLRLFAGLLGLVVGLAEIATATAHTVANGRNVTSVQVATGRFTMTGPQRWLERRDDGKTFNFVEVRRDKWSVYLLDSSRGVNLQIDLRNKQIFYSDTTSPRRSLYPIVGATAAPSQAPLVKAAPPQEPLAPLVKAAPPQEPLAPLVKAAPPQEPLAPLVKAAPPQEPLAPLVKAAPPQEPLAPLVKAAPPQEPLAPLVKAAPPQEPLAPLVKAAPPQEPLAPLVKAAPPQEPLAPLVKAAPPQEPLAPPEVQPPPAPQNTQEFDYQSFARSPEFANETLTAHNELRARHGAQPLRWSTELARTANDWALSMTSTRCEMEHSGGDQIDIRLGDMQLVKKRVLHRCIVVLPGVQQPGAQSGIRLRESPHNGSNLHEIWSRANNAKNLTGPQYCAHGGIP